MGLITKEVEIKLNAKTVEHYKSLGYKIPMKEASESYNKIYHKEYVYDFRAPIKVKVEDLTSGSSAKVQVLCDYCHDEIMTMTYYTYLKSLNHIDKSACRKCKWQKEEEYFLMKYGVRNPSQLNEVKEKYRSSCVEKFGVDNYFKTAEFEKKRKESMSSKYGVEYPLQSKEIQEKWRDTCMNIYGFSNPAKSQEVKNKTVSTNMERYCGASPANSLEVREKMVQTLYKNSSQKVSKQQNYINNLYNGVLNFPVKYYNVDIYLPNDNLIVEYDGGGHMLNVVTGRETMEEYTQKETIRNNVIKREGYKQMRIISSKDMLPSDQTLLQMLENAQFYFYQYPEHSWVEYNIDTFIVRNAEHKDGIFFDYGPLRTIKDGDLNKIA